jgi:type IV secretory pathway VirD2 relaxase
MSVRDAVEARLAALEAQPEDAIRVTLASRLKPDGSVRLSMMKRLSSTMRFSYGAKAGALKTAANRSGSAFRVDVRQRVIVKALVSRHMGKGAARGAALAAHVRYLGREGTGHEGEAGTFFDRNEKAVDGAERIKDWAEHRHHFRFIISPENGDRIADLRDYTRDVMERVCADLGEPNLPWMAVCHFDTDQPHAHVLMPGRRASGRDLVIPRDYVAYGFRARAQEAAQERLGDLSRLDAERRVWRETQRDGFTSFDRRLLASMDGEGMVGDAVGGNSAWAALTRGRLAHLEALGLAERQGRRFRLDEDLEGKLRRLQISKDAIRTLNQRRLETGKTAEIFREGRVSGRVMKAGFHDELGVSPFVVVRDVQGVEHYARMAVGAALPAVGAPATLGMDARGVAQVIPGMGRGGEGLGL